MGIPVVIDTDPGIDDAVALWWALTSPALDVVAVTAVHGNVGVELAAANGARILHAAGRPDVPVAVGEATALGLAPVHETPAWIHGADGLGDVGLDPAPFGPIDERASGLLARLVYERPGEVAVIALGPLSNLAAVIRADPTWPAAVGRLVRDGRLGPPGGNATPAAEADIAHDPDAAAVVLGAAWPESPLLVTLDATHPATLGPEELALAREHRTPAAAFCDEPLRFTATPSAHPQASARATTCWPSSRWRIRRTCAPSSRPSPSTRAPAPPGGRWWRTGAAAGSPCPGSARGG